GLLVRHGQDDGIGGELGAGGQLGVRPGETDAEPASPFGAGSYHPGSGGPGSGGPGLGRPDLDRGNLGAQRDPGAQPGQQGSGRVAVQLAQRPGGYADVGGVVPAEQAGLHHGGGQRQRSVVTGDVQGRNREQVPQGTTGPLALAPGGEPVTEALGVN